jgi:beta-glucosidase
MGAAFSVGLQTHNVVATVKHFALNSVENARFKIDVRVDDRTLREVYLPHFRRTLDAGCATVMSAYNKMNGEYCGQNRTLLTDILRHEWGFDGFVHSDWLRGVYSPYGAAAGLDVENPEPLVFGEKLLEAVKSGAVEPGVIDQACSRILRVIYRFASAEDPLPAYTEDMVASPAHRALALEAAEKSAVLLKNDDTLPLREAGLKRLAVLGRLAGLENTGDHGSSRVSPPYVVTPVQGLRDYAAGRFEIVTAEENDLEAASRTAASADAVVAVVGYTAKGEGEYIPEDMVPEGVIPESSSVNARGGDRSSLDLPADQIALIKAAAASGKPLTVVIVAGSAVMMEDWHTKAGAILQSFYAGMEGGKALARLLFGAISPSGKLPFTVARDPADYPFFDPEADRIEYGPLHGYTLMERHEREPRFPFGHGLSYSRFGYSALKVRKTGERIDVAVSVTNVGEVAAEEVVQFYVAAPGVAAERPKKLLKGFARVALEPGQTKTVRQTIALRDLMWWSPARRDWVLETGTHHILAGPSSRDEELLSVALEL